MKTINKKDLKESSYESMLTKTYGKKGSKKRIEGEKAIIELTKTLHLKNEIKELKSEFDSANNELQKELILNSKQSSEIHKLRTERGELLFRKKELHDLKNKLIQEYFENTKTQRIEKTLQHEIIGILIDIGPDLIRQFLKPENKPKHIPTANFCETIKK